jgi:alpha-D-xyloside xylohydrolase
MATVLTFNSGPFQARIVEDSGSVALAGPDFGGAPHANVITFEPPVVMIGGQSRTIGRVVSSTPLPNGLDLVQDLGGTNVTARLTFPADGVMRYEVINWGGPTPRSASIAAAADPLESFFGFGERYNKIDQAGRLVKIRTFDQPGDKFDPKDPEKDDFAYKVTPWFMSSRGYGFHLDSSVESTFDMRKTAANRYIVSQPFIPDRSPGLALHVIAGPKLTDVLSRYTGLTGRPPLPPPWAFGPWISTDVWRTGSEVRYAVEKHLDRDLPASVFVFDSPWARSYNDFTFNEDQFADDHLKFENQPKSTTDQRYMPFGSIAELMAFLQQSGLKVICWMTPFINTRSVNPEGVKGLKTDKQPIFDDADRRGAFVRSSPGGPRLKVGWWKGEGSPIDFTNENARAFLEEEINRLLDKSLVDAGDGTRQPAIGGIKTDDGEAHTNPPALGAEGPKDGIYIPQDASYKDGRSGREMRNGYAVEYHKAIYTILGKRLGADRLIFARSGFHRTQAFPGCWAGDNQPHFGDANGLPGVIVAGLSAALSGFSIWSHDIGGYQNGPFSQSPEDLFMRWTQFGCFTPIMQMHRTLNQQHRYRQYPWGYPKDDKTFHDNAALRNYRFYAKLHTQLFPYIYTYAKESSETGLPIMRPLVLLHQDDRTTFGINHSYYFGNELLVAPVIEPNKTTRTVYLPQGRWIDYWTNQRIDRSNGGQDHNWSNSDRTKLPLFAREGAIIPMLLEVPQTLCDANYVNNAKIQTPGDGLLFRIYPAGTSRFTVYDGTDVTCQVDGGGVTVSIDSPTPRPVQLEILGPRPASGVRRDRTILGEKADPGDFAASNSAWRHDPTTGFLEIKFPHGGGSTTVTF